MMGGNVPSGAGVDEGRSDDFFGAQLDYDPQGEVGNGWKLVSSPFQSPGLIVSRPKWADSAMVFWGSTIGAQSLAEVPLSLLDG